MRLLSLFLLGLLAPPGAGGLVAAAQGDSPPMREPWRGAWVRVETPAFTLFGDVPSSRLVLIGTRLEAFRGTLESFHDVSVPSPRQTAIYVFEHAETGWPFTPDRALGEGHLGVNPPYDVGNHITVAAPDDDPPLEPLYHAYAHQFLDDAFPRVPLLVTEGLAGFYTGFGVVPEGTVAGLVNADNVAWLREHAEWPLGTRIGLGADAVRASPAIARRTFVAGSWALMHYLLAGGGDRRARLPMFLEELQRGTPADDAARAAFEVGLAGLQQAVDRYVRENRFPPLQTTGARVTPDASGFRSRPMPRDEVLAVLGDLIAHGGTDHDADAEAYFREALRLNPRQARAWYGQGYLRYARNRIEEAIPSLEEAVEIEADSLSCYLLAKCLFKVHAAETPTSIAPPWIARARDLLARAIALNPRFAAPYVTLGASHIRPDGDPAAGIRALERARILLPARTDIAGNLVYLYLRSDDPKRAQETIDGVIFQSGDAATLRAARAAMATYNDDLAAKAQAARNRKTEAQIRKEQAGREGLLAKLRAELESTTDPVARENLERVIARMEAGIDLKEDLDRAVATYNDAIAHANRRDYAQAITLLEGLAALDLGRDMNAQVRTTLERLRQDAARATQAGP